MPNNSKKKAPKIKIDNYTIHRTLGESFDWKKLDIKKKQVDALNEIGHTGKLKGKKTTIHDYFAKNIDAAGLKHEITSMKTNNMEFTDTLLVTRVTLK